MSDNMKDYKFDLPKNNKSIIKVIGVGGGGSNAVNHMFNQGIKDVEFVVVNTDAQALKSSPVPLKLQLGANLTEGLGAGANPEKGRNAAIESKEEIRELLSDNTKMVFITAGMGGGTGTGAAPVIAKIAKDMDILTVGIVTAPFVFEGKKKMVAAQKGIEELRANCDTVLVILNDKLREIYGNLAIRQAFGKADNILTTAAKSIAEIITVHQDVNVDINGVQKSLLSIMSGEEEELSMDELSDITEYIQERAGEMAEGIFGQGIDPDLKKSIRVTVIATGFEADSLTEEGDLAAKKQEEDNAKKLIHLESGKTSRIEEEPAKPGQTFTFSIQKAVPTASNGASYEMERKTTPIEPIAPQPVNQIRQEQEDDFAQPEPKKVMSLFQKEDIVRPSIAKKEENSYNNDYYEEIKEKAMRRAHERFEKLRQMRALNQTPE